MKNETLLIVCSFGTSHTLACERNIEAVERYLAESFPHHKVRRAFTSGMVRNILARRGETVDDLSSALDRARQEGFRRLVILPTHLLYGEEYEKLCRQAEAYRSAFEQLTIAKPLLASTRDLYVLAQLMDETFPPLPQTALVLMGHGTKHYANSVYAAMQTLFRLLGRPDVFVGTVEAWPGIDEIVSQLEKTDFKNITLTPLMLVAGDHAVNDMDGTAPDSWRSILENHGFVPRTVLRGLGEYEEIQKLYARHAEEAVQSLL